MRICKFCGKPIDEGQVWNPDNEGDGYHHHCLIDMEFKARDSRICNKEKKDILDKIMTEMQDYSNSFVLAGRNDLASAVSHCIEITDKYKESED